jgi:butyrate kinase
LTNNQARKFFCKKTRRRKFMATHRILVINPGSMSTKIAVFENTTELFRKNLQHSPEELSEFKELIDQFEFRKQIVEKELKERSIPLSSLDIIMARGGLIRPVKSGVYKINQKMLSDLRDPTIWGRSHASNLGAFIATAIADEIGIPAYIADPVTVDEMEDVARISGVPEIKRQSIFHALNIKSIARKTAQKVGKALEGCNLVAAHMGGGVSIAAIHKGRVVDDNNALLGMGAFSPQRAGSLPLYGIIDLCYSGKYSRKELERKLLKTSGLMGYLGTDDGRKIEQEIENGNKEYENIFFAMAYQISKEIGAYSTVLKGNVDAIFLTGGLARSRLLTHWIIERTGFIAPTYIFPGEGEMEALAEAGLRVLQGKEIPKDYL